MKKRAPQNLSHYKLLTCDMGQLIPCGWTLVNPGDTFQHATQALIRSSPLNTPVMHPVNVKFHHWFVPFRLLDEGWEKFITGGEDGMDTTTPAYVEIPEGGYAIKTLADYLGLPTSVQPTGTAKRVSAYPFRAYNLIVNENYRDQDLVTKRVMAKTSGLDTTTDLTLFNVAWEKDYFTTARPWTQKGPDVTLPLGTRAPVLGVGTQTTSGWGSGTIYETGGTSRSESIATAVVGQEGSTGYPEVWADLSEATAATINELRIASALQRYEEARARYGSRYTEYLAYLGIKASDARLQRPEYLGGGKNTIQFSEVLQTAPTTAGDSDGVGQMLGHGIGAVHSNKYRKFFEEHGIIMTLMYVLPKTMYCQGIHRDWTKFTKEDYWQKELQHVGQQSVKYKEIYAAHTTPDDDFGHQDRYDEYRRKESGVCGEFKTTLNTWHYARIFSSDPALNSSFITSNPTKRVNQDQSNNVLWCMIKHNMKARRLVSQSGTSFLL